jgi:hypothetical protein
MKAKNKNLMTLEEFKELNYGKRGTKKRDELEAGSDNFLIGVMLQQARLEKGLTQEELAENHTFPKSKTTSKKFVYRHFKKLLSWVWEDICNSPLNCKVKIAAEQNRL